MAGGDATALVFAWRYVRTRGPAAMLRGLVRRFVFARSSWIITHGFLPGPPPEPDPQGIVFRRATPEDLADLDSLRPHLRPEELRSAVRDEGCALFVACDGERIVAFRLVGLRPMRYFPLTRYVDLGEHDVWVHESFCHPEYRSRGVARRLALASDDLLAQDGWRRRMSAIRTDNIPSLRMSFGRGTKPLLHVSSVRFLLYRRYRASTQLPAAVREIFERARARDPLRRGRVAALTLARSGV